MEQRLSMITLGVADLSASVGFYERLGWRRVMPELTGVAFFQCPSLVFGLYPLTDLAADAGLAGAADAPAPSFRGAALAYNTRAAEEVAAVLEEAAGAGARILKPSARAFWGGVDGYFTDPDDHLWEVAWNPGLEFDQDGGVRVKG